MTIRPATEADIDAIVAMAERFRDTTSYRDHVPVKADCVRALALALVREQTPGVMLVAADEDALVGMVGMLLFTHPMTGEPTALELCWWVEPEARGRGVSGQLLAAAETWAWEAGATVCQLAAPSDFVGALYERRGYQLVERMYQRRR